MALEHSILLATLRSSFSSRAIGLYLEKFQRYRSNQRTTCETCLIAAILPTTSIRRLNNGCRRVIFQDRSSHIRSDFLGEEYSNPTTTMLL
ncbi:hypothetical protein C8J56DRAFT_931606, partial [Mycena floridula]